MSSYTEDPLPEEAQRLLRPFIEDIWLRTPKIARQAVIDLKTKGDHRSAAIWQRFTTVDIDINDRLEDKGLKRDEGDFSTIPRFADLATVFAGDLSPEQPAVAETLPGKFLLYAGRLNEQHGEPATGKTNIALILCIRELTAGHTVLFLDPEDNAYGICRKLLAFGADPAMVIERFKYCQNPARDEYLTLQVWADRNKPALVVLDGLADAISGDGLDEDKAGDFLTFCRNRLRPFAACGAAVLVSDHVTKSTENRRYSRGTGAKLGRYDGVVFELDLARAYSPTSPGCVELKIAKDRNGGVGKQGDVAVAIEFSPRGDGTTAFSFCEKAAYQSAPEPTWYMQAISEYLEITEDAGHADVRKAIGKKAEYVDKAIAALETQGFIKVHSRPGIKTRYEVVKPYRQAKAGA